MIDNVPSNCSNAEFKRHLQSLQGIRSVYFGHPLICPAQGLYRFVWITCESQDACKAVLQALSGDFEYIYNSVSKMTKKVHLHCQLQPSFKKQYYLPALLNQPSYIEEDLKQCYQLLHALEDYYVFTHSLCYV